MITVVLHMGAWAVRPNSCSAYGCMGCEAINKPQLEDGRDVKE